MKFKLKTKIVEFDQPLIWPVKFYVGLCGDVDTFSDTIDYLRNPVGRKPPRGTGGDFVILTEDRKIFTFKNPSKWLTINQNFCAVGSGMTYAMSAMECGKTPIEAVKVASKFDLYTGMGFKHIDIS